MQRPRGTKPHHPQLETLEQRRLLSGGPRLVRDIETSPISPSFTTQSANVGARTVFVHSDVTHGTELWATDGTAAATTMLKDIWPGANSSQITNLTAAGNYVYFSARENNVSTSRNLWRTDGTAAGTVPMMSGGKRVVLVDNSTEMAAVGSNLFFTAIDDAGIELWKTDGTNAGTGRVADLYASGSSNPQSLTNVNGTLYFTAYIGGQIEALYRSNGTAAGTVKVVAAGTNGTLDARSLIVPVGGKMFIVARDQNSDDLSTLWTADPSSGTATEIRGGVGGQFFVSVNALSDVGGVAFFGYFNPTTNAYELWKSDGTSAGTTMFRDSNVTPQLAKIQPFKRVGTNTFFAASDSAGGLELWKTNGTAAGTAVVKDINPSGSALTDLANTKLAAIGNTLLFAATNGTSGYELYTSDGTSAGTNIVKDINAGVASSSPDFLTTLGGNLLFLANDQFGSFKALWRTDATTAGTALIKDIYPATNSSNPSNLTPIGNLTFFTATTAAAGTELWRTDGTTAGTVLVKDICPGATSSLPAALTNLNGVLYFLAKSSDFSSIELWKSDGTAAGTTVIKDTGIIDDPRLMALNGKLYFKASDASTIGTELWTSDGTTAGTKLVKDILPGTGSSYPTLFGVAGNQLYFGAFGYLTGFGLWKTDGTAAGTVLVKSAIEMNFLGIAGTHIYYSAYSETMGTELWSSDGTSAGTFPIDINPGSASSGPSQWASIGNTGYFLAGDATNNRRLWKTDGTATGTTRVGDPANLPPTSGTTVLYAANGKVFFNGLTGNSYNTSGLWVTDGTAAGTMLLKSLVSYQLAQTAIAAADGVVYFRGADPKDGIELWRTDGTVAGTFVAADLSTFANGSSPNNLVAVGRNLYFTANDGIRGYELYVLEPTDTSPPARTNSAFAFDKGLSVAMTIDETVDPRTVGLNDLVAMNLTTGATFDATSATLSPDGRTITFALPSTLPDGNYRMRLKAGSISDLFGNSTVANADLEGPDVYVLGGDADRNRTVNFDDLIILAQNYNKTGQTFSQGNFDLDPAGTVNFDDLVILAQRYNLTLAALPFIAAVQPSASAASTKRRSSQMLSELN